LWWELASRPRWPTHLTAMLVWRLCGASVNERYGWPALPLG
jgi:hypothetical protein